MKNLEFCKGFVSSFSQLFSSVTKPILSSHSGTFSESLGKNSTVHLGENCPLPQYETNDQIITTFKIHPLVMKTKKNTSIIIQYTLKYNNKLLK